jgi:hypothetical protein
MPSNFTVLPSAEKTRRYTVPNWEPCDKPLTYNLPIKSPANPFPGFAGE